MKRSARVPGRKLSTSLKDHLLRRSGRFMDLDGDKIMFTIDRERLDAATFSADALDQMCDQLRTWIWSRVARAYSESGYQVPPKHLTVSVAVEIDSKAHRLDLEAAHVIDPAEWTGER